jgi:hypothetical protein
MIYAPANKKSFLYGKTGYIESLSIAFEITLLFHRINHDFFTGNSSCQISSPTPFFPLFLLKEQ